MTSAPTKTTTLALSYGDLLRALVTNQITDAELATALILGSEPPDRVMFRDDFYQRELAAASGLQPPDVQRCRERFVQAVTAALETARIIWPVGAYHSWQDLNQLLRLNGLPRVMFDPSEPLTPHALKRVVREQQLPYTLLWEV
jgi:hypothetical protein